MLGESMNLMLTAVCKMQMNCVDNRPASLTAFSGSMSSLETTLQDHAFLICILDPDGK